MANVPESASYDAGIYQLETTDQVLGGSAGIANAQAKGLANRTAYLKGVTDALVATSHGQCRLTFVSATSLKLAPFNGRNLLINGVLQQVTAAGVTVANTSLSASTLYYVYAYMSGSTMTLEVSTTGHSQDATTGVEVKTGNATRTLVGMCRTNSSSQFVDDATNVCVLSWFNRRRKIGSAKFTANRTLAASVGVFAEVNTEIRVNFLSWVDELVRQAICGGWTITGVATGYGYANVDNDTSGQRAWCCTSASTTSTFASVDERLVTEGYHFGSLTGSCTGGTNVLFLGGQNGEVSHLLTVMG